MAGSLIKIDEEIVSSAVSSVTLGGANWDSSYDVYKVVQSNVTGTIDDKHIRIRFLKASDSSPDDSSNYDEAGKMLRADSSSSTNSASTNSDYLRTQATGVGTATGEVTNSVYHLFSFNNASEFNFLTSEETQLNYQGTLFGTQGGGVHTVAQASNGLQFYMNSGNIASGTFTLYGLKK